MSFQPFRDDSCNKSKANFIDNFCDPDERVFNRIDKMTEKCRYYVEESFNDIAKDNIEFSFIHFNIRSLGKHLLDLECYLNSLSLHFDVIALSETWLKDSDDINLYVLPNYHSPVFLNRPNEDGGGGLALYISIDYNFKRCENITYNSDDTQFLFVEIEKMNIKTLIGVTYKPPKTSIDSYLSCFSTLLDKIGNNARNCFIAGDYNIDLLKVDNNEETSSFFNNLLSYSYFPSIVKPTRITTSSATLIDNDLS